LRLKSKLNNNINNSSLEESHDNSLCDKSDNGNKQQKIKSIIDNNINKTNTNERNKKNKFNFDSNFSYCKYFFGFILLLNKIKFEN